MQEITKEHVQNILKTKKVINGNVELKPDRKNYLKYITCFNDENQDINMKFQISYNYKTRALNFTLICNGQRIFGICFGQTHHNPYCTNIGDPHKHLWDDKLKDKVAENISDITNDMSFEDKVRYVAKQCGIIIKGMIKPIPQVQGEFDYYD